MLICESDIEYTTVLYWFVLSSTESKVSVDIDGDLVSTNPPTSRYSLSSLTTLLDFELYKFFSEYQKEEVTRESTGHYSRRVYTFSLCVYSENHEQRKWERESKRWSDSCKWKRGKRVGKTSVF